MRKLLMLVPALAMASPAFASDLPIAPIKAIPYVASYDWSGIYAGGHIGGGRVTDDISDPGLGLIGTILNVPVVQTNKNNGFLGGVQIGSNYQFGKFVIGTEADLSWSHLSGGSVAAFGPTALGLTRTLNDNTDWTGTMTTRLGIASNNWLFYGKAGTAFVHNNYSDNWTVNAGKKLGNIPLFMGAGSDTRIGWTVGTGIEWAFMTGWSAKLEYDYMNYGQNTETMAGTILPTVAPTAANFGVLNSQQVSEIKLGVNYRFMSNIW